MSQDVEKKLSELQTSSVKEEPLKDVDQAYQFAKEHCAGPLSDEDDRRILRKIDFHLLPLVRCHNFARSELVPGGFLHLVQRR
jgi:hypothetical protein